ncbi:MAG: aminotransferase [Proteobacteria bacterium]|nr:aminotransferase [Pseudomonadota bacterium]MDA1285340.1 aminotransferase [Pseudomonadota bacterium]
MTKPLNPHLAATFAPPVMESRRWLAGASFTADRPLINVSQAAPVDPPPLALRQIIADAALNNAAAHVYGPVLGMPALKAEVATQWSAAYGGAISENQLAITSGCNQAFCAAVATLAAAGDAVMIPTPWYFNHKMWLDMTGVESRLLPCGAGMLPDPEQAEALLDSRVKAILLVTPNNPTGAEYPAGLVQAFYDLAKKHGIALIVDETYRDFDARTGAPHDLFKDPDWSETLIHLYSFSKAYRLTGHRVGAMVASQSRLAEVEKVLDTITICPNQLGQIAALYGMQNLGQWLAGERDEILDRRAAISEGFPALEGWKLLGAGAYFAYVEHPFGIPSDQLAQELVSKSAILMLPGTMFAPRLAQGGNGDAERQLRIAFANVDRAEIQQMFARLSAFSR